jgi:peptidoglycan hydrolase CwlO-like protein
MINLDNLASRATTWIGSTASLVTHTVIFIGAFLLVLFGIPFDRVLLVLTTAVSLEAIYLSIFIQISVNRHESQLHEISEDVEDIQEDIEEISDDVEDIQEDIEEIHDEIEEE